MSEKFGLMAMLKTVETGLFMSLAGLLSPLDNVAAITISSMANVATRQTALLRRYSVAYNSSMSSETPITSVWAYNMALSFVQAGSCALDLPIPALPWLRQNDKTYGMFRYGENLTLSWDNAARSTISRSGKPLFVGWISGVKAPRYTPLFLLGDSSGVVKLPEFLIGDAFAVLTTQPGLADIETLTKATLAGPFIINLVNN
jgi:hypothetical protein